MRLTHVSLFSGIGGIDLAAEISGFSTKVQVEINPYCRKILSMRFPNAKQFTDIRDVTGDDIFNETNGESPTVVSGGFPCQPISKAGNRLGSKDERWLWPEYHRLIRETKPRWILAENVERLTNIPEFKQIYSDLEKEGYEVWIFSLSAADYGAPHIRKRCFVLANSCGLRLEEDEGNEVRPEQEESMCPMLRGNDTAGIGQTTNTCNITGLQTDTATDSIGEEWISWEDVVRSYWGESSLPGWEKNPPMFCRMDDGVPPRVDKPRLQALGNAVVPRMAEGFFKGIREYEDGINHMMLYRE